MNRRGFVVAAGAVAVGGCTGLAAESGPEYDVEIEGSVIESVEVDAAVAMTDQVYRLRVEIAEQEGSVRLFVTDDTGERSEYYLPGGRTQTTLGAEYYWRLPITVEARTVDGELLDRAHVRRAES